MKEPQPLVFEDITIEVPWGFIAGRWYGNRKVRPILALHGWQDNLGTWDRLIPLMPRHVGILAIDFPGHGRSSKYPVGMAYHVIDYLQIVVRIVKEYKWRKVSLMGHSMGSVICLYYAALFPHMTDLVVQFDTMRATNYAFDFKIRRMHRTAEKSLIENNRLEDKSRREPPTYSYSELEVILHKGSGKSVAIENCKYLLNRSVTNSELYPEKYYFSRDGRIKFCTELPSEQGLYLELAKRIRNIPYMVIRSDKYSSMTEDDEEIIEILKANNPHFEYYRCNGTHHFHLNNAEEVVEMLNPFLLRHRPLVLDSWSLDDSLKSVNQPEKPSKL